MRVVSIIGLFLTLISCTEKPVLTSNHEEIRNELITTLILVRHAEKEKIEDNDNPPLNVLGKKRAKLYSSIFINSKMDAIYSTPFNRNINTVKPLADTLNISITTYDPNLDLVTFINKVKEENTGKKVLICGHSNTIPEMLNILLGNEEYSEFLSDQYNDIFMVSSVEGGSSVVTTLNIEL